MIFTSARDDQSRWLQGLTSATLASAIITAWFVPSLFNPDEMYLTVVFFEGRAKEAVSEFGPFVKLSTVG